MLIIEDILRNFTFITDMRSKGRPDAAVIDLSDRLTNNVCDYSDIYIDVTRAIRQIGLTTEEAKVLLHIMEGYNYSEIARFTGVKRLRVAKLFAGICVRLARQLNTDYQTNFKDREES